MHDGWIAAGDLHWAPDTRLALETSVQTAKQQGLAAAGTPHLLLGLLACSNAAVTSLLSKPGIQLAAFAASVHEAAGSCKELSGPGQLAGGDAAAAQLVQQYQQYIARHGSAAPTDSTLGSRSFRAANVGQQGGQGDKTAASPSPQEATASLVAALGTAEATSDAPTSSRWRSYGGQQQQGDASTAAVDPSAEMPPSTLRPPGGPLISNLQQFWFNKQPAAVLGGASSLLQYALGNLFSNLQQFWVVIGLLTAEVAVSLLYYAIWVWLMLRSGRLLRSRPWQEFRIANTIFRLE
eukprot:gene8289-8476_t